MAGPLLTHSERVRAALGHEEGDRVPFDLFGTPSACMSRQTLGAWLEDLGIEPGELDAYDPLRDAACPSQEVLSRLYVDTAAVRPTRTREGRLRRDGDRETYLDPWSVSWVRTIQDGEWGPFSIENCPLSGATSPADVEAFNFPTGLDDEAAMSLEEDLAQLDAEAGRAVVAWADSAGLLETAFRLRGLAQFLSDLRENEALACAILDRILDVKLAYWERVLGRWGDRIELAFEADLLADASGLVVSRGDYRRLVKPRQRALFSRIRALGAGVVFHAAGNVLEIVEDLVDAGVDALAPAACERDGMDARELARTFGDVVTFWGAGPDPMTGLRGSRAEELADDVKRRIDIFAPNGGFVFAPSGPFPDGTPADNITVMWKTALTYGRY